jgi:hypothetical protein
MFDCLKFEPHTIPECIRARYKFPNDWEISVVAGPPNCGLYGNINENTYEVAILRPNGHMTEDVSDVGTLSTVVQHTHQGC